MLEQEPNTELIYSTIPYFAHHLKKYNKRKRNQVRLERNRLRKHLLHKQYLRQGIYIDPKYV